MPLQAPLDALLLSQAAMQYIAHEAMNQLLFGHNCTELLGRNATARNADLLQQFYDDRRRAWLDTVDPTSTSLRSPQEAIMPHLQTEVASPQSHSH